MWGSVGGGEMKVSSEVSVGRGVGEERKGVEGEGKCENVWGSGK